MSIKNHWWVFIATGLMVILVNLDSTIVNIALPAIAASMHASITDIQWVVNIYFLAAAILVAISGRLADLWGKRRVFMTGIAIFVISSASAGFSTDITVLLISRLCQGIGFSGTLGIGILIAIEHFPIEKRGFATGAIVTLSGIAQVIGPTLGGIIVDHVNWHWIFLINLPLGLLSFILTYFFVKPSPKKNKQETLDISGAIIYAITLTCFLASLNNLSTISASHLSLMLAIAIIGFVAFYIKCRMTTYPLISITLLHHPQLAITISIRFIFMFIWMSLLFLIPIYLQNILNFSAEKSGVIFIAMTALIAITSPIAGVFFDKVGFKPLLVLSGILCFISYSLLLMMGNTWAPQILIPSFICFGIATGLLIPGTVHAVTYNSRAAESGTAIGLFYTFAFIAASMGVAIAGSYIDSTSLHNLHVLLLSQNISLTADQLTSVKRVANGIINGDSLNSLFPANISQRLIVLAHTAYHTALHSFLWINTVLSLVLLLLCCFLKNSQRKIA